MTERVQQVGTPDKVIWLVQDFNQLVWPTHLCKAPESTRQVGTPNDMVPIRWILVKHCTRHSGILPTWFCQVPWCVWGMSAHTYVYVTRPWSCKSTRGNLTTRVFVRCPRCDRACRHTQVYVYVRKQPHLINHKKRLGGSTGQKLTTAKQACPSYTQRCVRMPWFKVLR